MTPLGHTARHVVIGVARARLPWFVAVASWANAALVPIDFRKCLGVAEAHDRLDDGPAVVLLDAGLAAADEAAVRDLVRRGATVVAVAPDDASDDEARRWIAAGAATVLRASFSRDDLAAVLAAHPVSIPRSGPPPLASTQVDDDATTDVPTAEWRGAVVAVTGVRGVGVSTVAMALAQGAAARTVDPGGVVVADLARDASHAMYHDVRDVVPGLQEMCEASARHGVVRTGEWLFDIASRRYSVLVGVRRREHLDALGTATADAVDALAAAHRLVVVDVDANDLDRAGDVDLAVVVGDATLRGLHGLVREERRLIDGGFDAGRVLRVVNRAPRSPRARAELAATIRNLGGAAAALGPLFLPVRRGLEVVHQVVGPLPDALAAPLAGAADGAIRTRRERSLAIVGNSSRSSRHR